jgi:hypothetical protein
VLAVPGSVTAMAHPSPWVNPSPAQEQAWQEQRLAALAASRQAVEEVLRLRGIEARRLYLAAYAAKWGRLSAEGLEMRVRKAWEERRA